MKTSAPFGIKPLLIFAAVSAAILTLLLVASCLRADEPPGSIKLLPGYRHKTEQGDDSRVGKIWKEGGLSFVYEIGWTAGESANERDKAEYAWWREQTVNNHLVRIAMTKNRQLIVTFTGSSPANFLGIVKSDEDIADMLLMVLTYKEK